jgi:hypothetical protein
MRTLKLLLVGAMSAGLLLTACDNSANVDCSKCQNQLPTEIDNKVRGEQAKQFKAELASSLKEELSELQLVKKLTNLPKNLSQLDPLLIVKTKEDKDKTISSAKEDAALVNSIFNSLIAAEKQVGALKVDLSMSEEPIDGGLFLFAIASENARVLELQMYDEADFSVVANNQISLLPGNNYKAINLKDFKAGNYLLKLIDKSANEEIVRKISILPENLN